MHPGRLPRRLADRSDRVSPGRPGAPLLEQIGALLRPPPPLLRTAILTCALALLGARAPANAQEPAAPSPLEVDSTTGADSAGVAEGNAPASPSTSSDEEPQGSTAPEAATAEPAPAKGGWVPGSPLLLREVLDWQSALEARGFSPGLVDGLAGPKTVLATRLFQVSAGLDVTGELSAETARALEMDPRAAVAEHRITTDDERQVDDCPPDWNVKARKRRLLYPSLANCLAEAYHTSERCLRDLNPGVDLSDLRVGMRLRVPRLRKRIAPPGRCSVEIDLSRKVIVLIEAPRHVRAMFHCSVAKDVDSVQRGASRIETIVADPTYTFDPKKWPEVTNVRKRLLIPPGPRSPVGSRWMGLDRPGVGIHGTAEPENIGKTGSHGCFRMTNWDAVYLASLVSIGTAVNIVDRSAALDRIAGDAPSTASR